MFDLQHFLLSGCGSVGRAIASDTRGLQFASSPLQILMVLSTALKNEKKEKRGSEWLNLKTNNNTFYPLTL